MNYYTHIKPNPNPQIYSIHMNHLNWDLCQSSEFGDVASVKRLLDSGADARAYDSFALCLSSENGHVEVVKLLLEAGAVVHTRGSRPLLASSENGHTEVVRLLLAAGADVNARNSFSLCMGAYNGHTEVVKLLLEAGANVNRSYPLNASSIKGHTEIVKLLLDAGTNAHIRDSLSICNAALNGHTEVVRLLLSRGAAWNAAWNATWKEEIPHEVVLKPNIRRLLVATFTLRRWVRSRLMRLRLRRIGRVCLMNRVCIELQYAPPKGSFRGGIKYIESRESFQKRVFWLI